MTPYYEKNGITIYHGDCREVLPLLNTSSVAAVVVDPPYGINTKSDGNGKLNPWADLCNASLFYEQWIGECRRILADNGSLWSCLNWRSLVTFQKAACALGWPIESLVVWDKEWIGPGGSRGLRPSYELVALWCCPGFSVANRGVPDVQRFKWSSRKPNGHPAEKPVALMRWCIENSSDGIVLDPFTGSGTTLKAAADMHRRAIGIEIDERYCEIAARRLEQATLPLAEAV